MTRQLPENNRNAQRTYVDGRQIQSFFGAEAFKAKFNSPRATRQHGTGGAQNFNISTDDSGEVTINAHQCDIEEVQFLESLDPTLPRNFNRKYDIRHKDLRTGREIIAKGCKLTQMPEYTMAEEATARVFVFECAQLTITPGIITT